MADQRESGEPVLIPARRPSNDVGELWRRHIGRIEHEVVDRDVPEDRRKLPGTRQVPLQSIRVGGVSLAKSGFENVRLRYQSADEHAA